MSLFKIGLSCAAISLTSLVVDLTRPAQAQNLVKVVVEQNLYEQITPEISQYIRDLEGEGYTISLSTGNWADPTEVRALLQTELHNGLVGAVLVGRIPMAQFNLPNNVNDTYWHNFYTPLYYMDLDGVWGGQQSGVYTSHSGNRDPEIWVGVIRAENLPAAGNETDLIRKYFQKVHAFRTGNHYLPPARAFQFYHTIKPNYADLGLIFSEVSDYGCATTADRLLQLFQDENGYYFGTINTASGASVHHFHKLPDVWPLPESYWLENHVPDDVNYENVKQSNPKILFYHLATSETGRFDMQNNLSGMYVFGTDFGLGALASTQHSIIGDSFYKHLAEGKSIGESFKEDFKYFLNILGNGGNTSTEWCPSWDPGSGPEILNQRFYSAIYVGDPTLRVAYSNVVDNKPPQIYNVTVLNITMNSAEIHWETDEPSDSQVEFGLTTSYGQTTKLQPDLVREHKVVLSDLTMNSTYHFRVLSRDKAGNVSISEDYTFTTEGDRTPPQITSLQILDISETTARFTWKTDEPADAQVEFGFTEAYGQASPRSTSLSVNHSIVLTGLQPNTTYHARALSRDAHGNLAFSNDTTFKTIQKLDQSPPIITNIQVNDITSHSARITWQTNEPATGQVEYGTSTTYGKLSPLTVNLQTMHEINLEGLLPGTVYHFRVHSADSQNNKAVSTNRTFTTLGDNQAPLIYNIAVEELTSTSALISWETSEPATGHINYGTSLSYGQSTPSDSSFVLQRSIKLRDLKPNSTYYFKVVSVDSSGNQAESAGYFFLTPQQQPSFYTKVEAESMQVQFGEGFISENGNALSLVPGSKIVHNLDYPEDDIYLIIIKFRQTNYHRTADVVLLLDDVPQANLRLQSERYTLSTIRSFVAKGRHKMGLSFADTPDAPQEVVIDWVVIVSSKVAQVETLSISSLEIKNITDATAVVGWQTNIDASGKIEYGTDRSYSHMQYEALPKRVHSFVLTGLQDTTTYYIRVSNQVPNSTESVRQESSFVTLYDRFAPVLKRVMAVLKGKIVSILWESTEPVRSKVHYGLSETPGVQTLVHENLTQIQRDTLYNLEPNSTYHFKIEAIDRRGNIGHSNTFVFISPQRSDAYGYLFHLELEHAKYRTGGMPLEEGGGWELTQSGWVADSTFFPETANYSFNIHAKAMPASEKWPTIEIKLNGSLMGTIPVQSNEFQTYSTTLPVSQGIHEIAFSLSNPKIGNRNAPAVVVDWLTVVSGTMVFDLQPPVITQVQVNSISQTGAVISWQTNEPTAGSVAYGLTPAFGQLQSSESSAALSHVVSLNGLLADRLYYYKVIALDAAGNQTEGPVFTFKTLPAPTAVKDDFGGGTVGVPSSFEVLPSYPNPGNATTHFKIAIAEPGILQAVIYDLLGREVDILYAGPVDPGYKILRWFPGKIHQGSAITNGIYFLRTTFNNASGFSRSKTIRFLLFR